MQSMLVRASEAVASEVLAFHDRARTKAARPVEISEQMADSPLNRAYRVTRSANAVGYRHFRHWVYSAVSYIARRCASQAVRVASIVPAAGARKHALPFRAKGFQQEPFLSESLKSHIQLADDEVLERIVDGELVSVLNRPNDVQTKYAFV